VPATVKTSCCRSLPRCERCPVLVAAHIRKPSHASRLAKLVEEVLVGNPVALPDPVSQALAGLAVARRAR
jgi:hypothetical protein